MASAFGSALGRILGKAPDALRQGRWRLPMQSAGVTVTWDVFMQYSAAWACVRCIAESIASSDWRVLQVDGEKTVQLQNDPLDWILNVQSNPETTAQSVKEMLLIHAATSGNGYAEIQRDNSGRVVALWPMSFDRCCPERRNGDPDGDLVYRFSAYDGMQFILEKEDVFHIRGPCSVTSLMGDNIVARSARSVALSLAAERFGASFYGNGTEVGTVITSSKPIPRDKMDAMRKDWNDWHQGPDRAHRPVILEPGMGISSLASKAGDYDQVKDRKYQLEEIARYFNVPLHKIQSYERATFSNIEHLAIEFVHSLTPWVKRIEQEALAKLIPRRQPKTVRIDTTWLSHGDSVSRSAYYEKLLQNGVASVNDVRKLEGWNTIGKAGDQRVKWSTMTTAEGIQAMVDQTNIENQTLLAGAEDPTPTLVDPPSDDTVTGGGDTTQARLQAHAQRLVVRGQRLLEAATVQAEASAPEPVQVVAGAAQVVAGVDEARASLFSAVESLIVGTLTRHGKRMAGRLAGHRKSTKSRSQIDLIMVGEREQARPAVLEELAQAMTHLQKYCTRTPSVGEFILAAEATENGTDPVEVAKALIDRATTNDASPVSRATPGIPGGE